MSKIDDKNINLDKLLKYLPLPDIKEDGTKLSFRQKVTNLWDQLITKIGRVVNFIFKDHVWYDEPKAHDLLSNYIKNPEYYSELKPQHEKIMQIYDRLAHISRNEGNWADGIDKEFLHNLMQEDHNDEEIEIPKLEEIIGDNIFIPDSPEEQIFEGQKNTPKRFIPDDRGKSYTFTRQKGINAPDNRTLFHIQADEFGSSSKLEGGKSTEMVQYLHHFLSQSNNPSYPKDIIDQLANTLSLQSTSYSQFPGTGSINLEVEQAINNAHKKISEAFNTQKPLLIDGGWIGQPSGHAIYYEIIPQSNKATFRLYNTGAGIETYHSSKIEGHKEKYQAYNEWNGIDREKLESPHFLEALFELKSFMVRDQIGTKTQYNKEDVYQGLKNLLEPKNESKGPQVELNTSHFMSPQRSGVCSWKSLMAFMRTKMEINDYKRFKCDIKLQSLRDYIDTHTENIQPADWRLVMKSHQNLCRSIVKLHQNELVGDAYIQIAQEELNQISNWIKAHSDCRYRKPIEKIPSYYTPCTDFSTVQNKHSFIYSLDKIRTDQNADATAAQRYSDTFEKMQTIETSDSTKIHDSLITLIAEAKKAWKAHDDLALHKGIIDSVSKLSIDEGFWSQAINKKPQTAESLIAQLGEVAQLFTKSCFTTPDSHLIFPEKVYVLNKILYIQEMICRLGHPNSEWKHLYLGFDKKENLFLRFHNAKMHREMNAIYNSREGDFIRVDKDKNDISTKVEKGLLLPLKDSIGLEFLYASFPGKSPKNKSFEELIQKEYPNLIQNIIEKDPEFRNLPRFAQEARIFTSADLPDWIKAIRDTHLASHHINLSSVGPLTTLDRERHLIPQFNIEDREKNSKVTVTLSGVGNDILKTHEVKNCKTHSDARYAGQYQEIKSQSIGRFINTLNIKDRMERRGLKEKEVANTSAKKQGIDISDEEFKEIARLFSNSDLQHLETLEYFTKHPEKLQDTDYQTLLDLLLFERGLLDKNLAIEGFGSQLASFIQHNYEHFSEENKIQTAVFLLKLAHQLHGFDPKQKFYNDTIDTLKALLSRKGLEDDDKILVYAELIAELGYKEILSEEETILLIAGSIFIEENYLHGKYSIDSLTKKEGREALLTHAQQIKNTLETGRPNQNLLNRISKTLRPTAADENKWVIISKEGEFPIFKTEDGSQTLYPLLPQLVSKDGQALIPLNIRQNPLFRQLFPKIQHCSFEPGNVISFRDSHDRETLASLNGDNLVVEQKQNGEWIRFVPSATFLWEDKSYKSKILNHLGSRYLAQQYTHWQAIHPNQDGTIKIYATDPKTGERQHVIVARAMKMESDYFILKEVRSFTEDLKLGKPSSLFTTFEDPAYIHEWYEGDGKQKLYEADKLKKIELPRFNLSFKPSPQNPQKLMCEQFPNFALNTTDPVKKLGIHHHYILLEDANKQRKLILPNQKLDAPKEKEVLLPNYELNRDLKIEESVPQQYYVFDVQKNGKLFSKSREANLYLAEMLTAAQEYKKAAHYLKKFGNKLSAYTSQENEILKNLGSMDQFTGDKSGDGTALQLYADYLRFKNTLSHHKELPDKEIGILKDHYNRYITQHNNVTVFKLEPSEETLLLKTFLSRDFDVLHFLRLKELDPIAAQKLEIPYEKSKNFKQTNPLDSLELFYIDFESLYLKGREKPHLLLTRTSEDIGTNFYYYYKIAKNGSSEEKQRLKSSLIFAQTALDERKNSLRYVIAAVLENPNEFPELPIESSYYNAEEKYTKFAKWKAKVEDAASKYVPKIISKQEEPLSEKLTLPKSFYLENKPQVKPPLEIQITLPNLLTISESSQGCFEENVQQRKSNIEELSEILKSFHTNDPVNNREVNRLERDQEAYNKQQPPPQYTIIDDSLTTIKQTLSLDKNLDEEKLESLEKEILALANKRPESPGQTAQFQLKRWGKLSKVITLEELIINFARNDYSQLLERNPALKEADLNEIANKVGSFLQHATRNQQRNRAEESLNNLEKCRPEEKNDYTNQLAERMLAGRMYDPQKQPAYLAFEYFANISMRPSQVEKLELFLSGGKPNLVMEMIMGSGKSKVLLPLLGLLRADGKNLSMLIVPQPLFESVSQDTQAILQAFSQNLSALHFDRHTKFTKVRLESIYDELVAIRQNRECLIMTSKSVQCLILKFIEESSAHFKGSDKNKEFSVELKLMQKILNLMTEHGYPIIDEADTVLNILHEVSFSGGDKVSPNTGEIELLSEIYGMLYENPKLKSLARLESDPNADEQASVLTEQLYIRELQKPLANAVIDRLGVMTFESKTLTEKLHHYVKNLDKTSRKNLLHYLCRDKEHIDSTQQYFNSLDKEIQNIFAFAGEQISHLLPYTLTRICDEKYGVDDKTNDPLAIPFSASQTPSSGSQFANPHITMNYTFQNYMKKGVTTQMVEKQVKLLQEKAMLEIAYSGGKLPLKETTAGKVFAKLKGNINMPLFNYKDENIEDLQNTINSRSEIKRYFVSHIILPQLEQFEYKMSCNPQNLAAFFPKVDGFTGTLWNSVSMHHKLKPEPAVGTDAKTLSILWEHSRNNTLTVKEGSLEETIKQLNELNVSFDMIADGGGYYKEGSNSEMAHLLAKIQGKEVVFYNSKGEQTITEGDKEIPLSQTDKSPADRLTFLDQSHTTGADVPQKLDAISIVTIGRNMLLRDLLQSVWRLRGLDKSQRVRFLVTEEVAGIIRQKLDLKADHPIQLDTILRFVIANQASQQGRDNYKSLKEGFDNIMQKILIDVLLHEKLTPRARMNAFVNLQSTWIKPAFFNSKELYGTLPKELDAKIVVELDKKQYVEKINETFEKMPWLEKINITKKSCLEEIDLIEANIKNSLPEKLPSPAKEKDDDQTVEVERETKKETERETQLEVQETKLEWATRIIELEAKKIKEYATFKEAVKAIKPKPKNTFSDLESRKISEYPIFPLKSYLEQNQKLKNYASAFNGIHLALNVLEWAYWEDDFRLLSSRRTDFHHLLVKDDKVTLLTQAEAKLFRGSPDYYNLSLGFNDQNKKLSESQQLKIVKLKFLNGECLYNTKELKYLELWFKTQGTEKMQKLYVEEILKGYPQKTARYQDSPLKKLFTKSK